jgi:hypothetical protein
MIIIMNVVVLALMSTGARATTVYYVDEDANGNDDGTSWTDAYNDLQDALSDANITGGDEIWVAKGTYYPDGNDPNNRDLSFELVANVGVYGGFDGNETSRSERDWSGNDTKLCGEIDAGPENYSKRIVIGADGAILDGFQVYSAYNESSNGGGLFQDLSSGEAPTKVSNCRLQSCDAKKGGAIYVFGGNSPNQVMEINNCEIWYNSATEQGGAIYLRYLTLDMNDCSLIGNGINYPSGYKLGGAVYITNGDGHEISHCVFRNNYCSGSYDHRRGGAIYMLHSPDANAPSEIDNCVFEENHAYRGGALYTLGGPNEPINVINCTFYDNYAKTTNHLYDPYGAAIYNGSSGVSHKLNVYNCIMWDILEGDYYAEEEIKNVSGPLDMWVYCCHRKDSSDGDPCFVDADNHDFHLRSDSPCINEGYSNLNYDGMTDIDGEARVQGSIVDIGADETPYAVHNITQDLWYSTIQDAIDESYNGDVIEVYPGSYSGPLDFDGKAIKITGSDPNDWDVVEATVIASSALQFTSGEDVNSVVTGCTCYTIVCNGSSPTITKCIITEGIQCDNGSSATIENNKILSSGFGISIVSSAGLIRNNWIYDSSNGIFFANATAAVEVNNNTIVDNSSYGIRVAAGTAPNVTNCILWNNDVNDLVECTATYSYIEDCNEASGTGNICGDANDPNFVDDPNDNYHLWPDSPCIDAGDPNGTYTGQVDIDFESRVDGNDVDMGGDEYHS